MAQTAYLSLGSNLGDREANLREAVGQLSELGEVTARSSLYESEPVDLVEQPWFLNAVIALRTNLQPGELLREILLLESSLGRVRTRPKGPRKIDIDILLYDGTVVQERGLTVPHPAMHERMFVLAPLAEIAPELEHPVLHRKICDLQRNLSAKRQTVRRLHAPWATNV